MLVQYFGLKRYTAHCSVHLHLRFPSSAVARLHVAELAATTVEMAFSSPLLFGVSLLVATGPGLVQLFPSGPPVDGDLFNQTCNLMTPLHSDNVPTAGTGGYSIETDLSRSQGYTGFKYTAGKEYTGSTVLRYSDAKL